MERAIAVPNVLLILREKFGGGRVLFHMHRSLFAISVAVLAPIALGQGRAEYVGGTAALVAAGSAGSIQLTDERFFAFYSKKAQVRVAYDQIDLLEYGQQAGRRVAMAVVISPIFLLSKHRRHFLTIGYTEDGRQQALVFRVDKSDIRATLVSLEARTGLKVQYQDEEARKAGKG